MMFLPLRRAQWGQRIGWKRWRVGSRMGWGSMYGESWDVRMNVCSTCDCAPYPVSGTSLYSVGYISKREMLVSLLLLASCNL
jgi:hypothetical protein